MPLYSGLSRSAKDFGTGLPLSAAVFTMMATCAECTVHHRPFGSFNSAEIFSQPLGL